MLFELRGQGALYFVDRHRPRPNCTLAQGTTCTLAQVAVGTLAQITNCSNGFYNLTGDALTARPGNQQTARPGNAQRTRPGHGQHTRPGEQLPDCPGNALHPCQGNQLTVRQGPCCSERNPVPQETCACTPFRPRQALGVSGPSATRAGQQASRRAGLPAGHSRGPAGERAIRDASGAITAGGAIPAGKRVRQARVENVPHVPAKGAHGIQKDPFLSAVFTSS